MLLSNVISGKCTAKDHANCTHVLCECRCHTIDAIREEIREAENLVHSRETNDPTAARAILDRLRAEYLEYTGREFTTEKSQHA